MEQNYIDLGIRNGGYKILFADHNLGASKPEEYGDYIALEDIPAIEERIRREFGEGWSLPYGGGLNYLFSDTIDRKWTNNYNGTFVAGLVITGKDSFSGVTLFLPAGGYQIIKDEPFGPNDYGVYWSRSLDKNDSDKAWQLSIDNYVDKYITMGLMPRGCECSIRPILVVPE